MAKLPWYLKVKDYNPRTYQVELEVSRVYIYFIKIKLFFTFILKVCVNKMPVFDRSEKVKS